MAITRFSEVKPKDLQALQGIELYELARRRLVTIRDSINVEMVLVCHLAKYLAVPEDEIIAALK